MNVLRKRMLFNSRCIAISGQRGDAPLYAKLPNHSHPIRPTYLPFWNIPNNPYEAACSFSHFLKGDTIDVESLLVYCEFFLLERMDPSDPHLILLVACCPRCFASDQLRSRRDCRLSFANQSRTAILIEVLASDHDDSRERMGVLWHLRHWMLDVVVEEARSREDADESRVRRDCDDVNESKASGSV